MRDTRDGMDRQGNQKKKKKGTSSSTSSILIRHAFETVHENYP